MLFLGIPGVDEGALAVVLGRTRMDFERLCPLARNIVKHLLLLARRVQRGDKRVLLARQPTFATVINLGGISSRRSDVRSTVQLDKGRAEDQALDMERWEGDKEGVGLVRRR